MDKFNGRKLLRLSIGERINYLYADFVCMVFGHKKIEKMSGTICYRCNRTCKF